MRRTWLLCLLHFRGLAFPKHLSPSAEGPSTSLSHYVWFCLCLDSQQTHRPTVYACTPSRAHFDRMFYRTRGFYLQNKWRKSILPALWNNSNLYGYSGGEHVAATSWCPTSITFGRKILSIATNSMRLCCSDFYTERKIKMCTPSSVCKAIYSSYQCNSHRDAVSLFMQLSTIKRISMLFFLLLSTSQSSYRHNTWKVIFLPRAYRRNRCVIPPADSPSHHQLTYTGSGIISHWSLLHLINSHLQTAVSDMRVHFWV